MIRNYNGNANRGVLRGLKKICDVCEENKAAILKKFNAEGKVSFYIDLDFFGMPDELSSVRTLTTNDEVENFLKCDFLSRIDGFLTDY